MSSTVRRTFTLRDALALVAATALGLAMLKFAFINLTEVRDEFWESVASFRNRSDPDSLSWWLPMSVYGLFMTLSMPFCWAWTLVVLALRICPPKPPIRRIARQPGAIACYSASVMLIPALIVVACLRVASWFFVDLEFDSLVWQQGLALFFLVLPSATGMAVVGGWATLFLGNRDAPSGQRPWRWAGASRPAIKTNCPGSEAANFHG